MHELSLSGAVVNTVVKHAAERPVSVVSLRVGRLRQVVPDTLEFYFEFVARGTVCEGARLEQEIVDAALRCNHCEREWEIEIPAFRCPTCGGSDVVIARGDEFEVESIEVESIEGESMQGESTQGESIEGESTPVKSTDVEEAECIAQK